MKMQISFGVSIVLVVSATDRRSLRQREIERKLVASRSVKQINVRRDSPISIGSSVHAAEWRHAWLIDFQRHTIANK